MTGAYANGVRRPELTPEYYYENFVKRWAYEFKVQIIGGCCGIYSDHIQYLHD